VVMLRTRQYRTGHEVLVGLGSGILGLVSIGVSLLWMHPEWRPTVAVTLAAAGAVLLAVTLLPATPSVRRGRLGDVAESVALLSLLPLLVIAVGLFSSIRG
jgi:ESX secretion system protein EccD